MVQRPHSTAYNHKHEVPIAFDGSPREDRQGARGNGWEMKKPVKHSFASERDQTGAIEIDCEKVAKVLAKNWGDIPKRINDTRAIEIHCLAKGYLVLQSKLRNKK